VQKANFDFFILAAMGVGSTAGVDDGADYHIVVSGDLCTPCQALQPVLRCVSFMVAGLLMALSDLAMC
jgi:hypothetical protein